MSGWLERIAPRRTPDGHVAILVDGQVVSFPKLADGPTAKGIVSGLDEATARRLADRLGR